MTSTVCPKCGGECVASWRGMAMLDGEKVIRVVMRCRMCRAARSFVGNREVTP